LRGGAGFTSEASLMAFDFEAALEAALFWFYKSLSDGGATSFFYGAAFLTGAV
jgi:hypothetical protein